MTDHNLLSAENVADPYPYFTHMRESCPVHWNENHRAWFFYRYEDMLWALRESALSSDRVRPVYKDGLSESERERRAPTFDVLQHWMVFLDPPEHTRIRKLVMPAFSAKATAMLTDRITEIVTETISSCTALTQFDLVRDFAYPIPAIVIAELMGIPVEDRALFKSWSDDILTLVFRAAPTREAQKRAQNGLIDLTEYLRRCVAQRRREPADDLVTRLIQSTEAEPPLTEDEIVATCALLIFGGHETTTNLLANGIRALLAAPEQWELLRRTPDLYQTAVEELLRYDGPSKMVMRRVGRDVEVKGHSLRVGDPVYLVQGSANRDREAFDSPETLDIARQPNRHVGFGFGVHHCLGNFLARLEAQIAIPMFVDAMPHLSAAAESEQWHPTLISRGMTTLSVCSEEGGR